MPIVGGGGVTLTVDLLPVAPTASDSAAAFPIIAQSFFSALWKMVDEVNFISSGFATPLSVLPAPPSGLDALFATHADAHLAAFPDLVSDVNGMITELSLSCGSIAALPTVPSRGSDPGGFSATAAVFLAAMSTFQTQLNAFITAFNGYSPSVVHGATIAAGSAGSVTVSWPTGTVAGDRAVISASGDFAVNTPSGWDTLHQADGSFINGEVMTKVLTSGDISTGNVTVTFAGTGSEVASCVAFSGAAVVHGATISRAFASGATLASWSDGQPGDTLVWFGDSEGGAAPTISRGATLQVRNSAPFSRVTSETLSGAGSVSATFTSAGDNWAASVAAGAVATTSLSVRGTRITAVNAASIAYTFPTGSSAGDMCLICVGHGFAVTTPSGWTQLDNSSGSDYNGAVFYKTLSSGDISTGSVTISFAGSFNGCVQGITFVGVPSSVRTSVAVRNGGSSVTVTTGSSPVVGDVAFYLGSPRGASVYPWVNRGAVLEKSNTANSTGIIVEEILTTGGAKSASFNYNSGAGDYSAIVVIHP